MGEMTILAFVCKINSKLLEATAVGMQKGNTAFMGRSGLVKRGQDWAMAQTIIRMRAQKQCVAY